jgi:hypothetical protein
MFVKTMAEIVGWACLAFSVIGFIEQGLEFWNSKGYHLGKAILYCLLFGIGIVLK